jgi:PAS domain S-box-containing protein
MDHVRFSLDDVLITAELVRRPTRSPDYEAEAGALTALAGAMADSPQTILQKLVETALDVCRADSAGISILEPGGATGVFHWHAIAGQFASNIGGVMLREASPCGVVLDRDASLLFSYPERHFDYGMAIDPPIVEGLLVPFHSEGKPVGTLWVIAHTPSRQFDAEDQRLLTSLSHFAAVSYQIKTAVVMTDAGFKAKADEVRQILDTSATGITRCSRDLRFLSANAAIGKLVGLPVEQIIGRPMVDVMGVKAFEVIRPYVERVLRGERVEYEEEFLYAPGWTKFMHVVYTPWIDSDGQVAGWVASVSDITDLKRTTKALRESEERLRLAMSSSITGIWDLNVSSGQLTVSPEVGRMFGLDVTELRSFEDLAARVHPDDLSRIESEREAAIRNHQPFDTEFRILLPSGDIRWIATRGQAYYDEKGHTVRMVGNSIDVTERVQAEEALREREQRLRLALDATGGGSWALDGRTGRVDWDDGFRKLYGFTAEEPAIAKAWPSRVHEEDRPRVLSILDEILRTPTRNDWMSTFRIVRPDGTLAWIESRCQADRDAEGHVVQLTGLDLDVTERRIAEERHEFLLRLSDALRPLTDPVEMQSAASRFLGEYLHVNRVSCSDINGDDFIVRASYALGVAPSAGRGSISALGAALLEAYRSGRPITVDDIRTDPRITEDERARLLAKDIVAFASVVLVKAGQWVSSFCVHNARPRAWTRAEIEIISDVAERTWEAVERARAEEALLQREQRLRLALDASRAGFWTWDVRTGRAYWDDRFRELYGFTPDEPARPGAWTSRVHEEDRQQVLGLINEILYTKTKDSCDNTYRIVRPDGTVAWIESLGQAERDAEGHLIRLTGLALDVTERRRAEEVLLARRDEERDRALQRQAEEALRRSHAELEQRTLQLRRLTSQLTLAEQHAREQLARTLHDGLQQQLFTAALALDRAVKIGSEANQLEMLQKARAEINEAVEAARTLSVNLFPPILHVGGLPAALSWLAKRTQEQYGVVVSVTANPEANPTARDIRILLFEAVRELMFNAVKHARVDLVDVSLAAGTDGTIHIQVSDEGVGFDPTVTLRHGDQHQLGLGLFSIRERLALLGGQLDIQSAPGKGARFSLTLPRTALSHSARDAEEAQHRDWQDRLVYDSASGTTNLLRILIADDHVVVRAGLREMLGERPELQVVGEAANGIEAISQVDVLQPDVVTMDVSMPQMNGIEATREIHRTRPHIQIVGLSTYGDEATERAMREAGAQAYFGKTESSNRLIDYLISLQTKAKGASAV